MVSKGSGVHTAIMGMWGMVCAWVCFRITGRRQESCLLCHPATGQAPGCTASALCLCISWETELIHSSVLTSSPHNPHQVLMPSSGQACVCRQVWVMLPPPTGVEGIGKHVDMRQEMGFSSVQFSRSVMSDSSRPHESQHARAPCPSPTPGVHSDSHPSSQ